MVSCLRVGLCKASQTNKQTMAATTTALELAVVALLQFSEDLKYKVQCISLETMVSLA